MSKEKALAFMEKIEVDRLLREKTAIQARNIDDLLMLARAEGFAFTPGDWMNAAREKLPRRKKGVLLQ